ncbi:hypothetical protein FB451DRAFT_1255579 [Mycena latifolia]|nr:hypothetical protein FB451DRAFT_1255579 [Mycena latifolia]
MFPLPALAGFLVATAASGHAQVASSSWRKPNITTSPADRVVYAGAAVEKGINMLGTDGQFDGEAYVTAGIFYSQMAEFDIVTNQRQYQDDLTQYFVLAQANRANFSDQLSYGHAAARAYTAYKNPIFLQYAIESWWFGRTYTLSQDNVDAGRIPGKNFTVQLLCQDITMAGGTFYTTDSTDPAIVGLGTGLSALLAEATPDPTYLQAAQQSTEFIQAHLYNIKNVVQDSISGRANDSCAVASTIEPYNSGLMIEALAILASISPNASTQALLDNIVAAAIPNTAWQGSNGIIANTGHGSHGDISLVQGLGVAYSRNVTSPALRAYIEAYLAVQFNAVLDLATTTGSNIYGAAWIGPPSSIFSGANQTAALSVLLSAIYLKNETTPTASGSSPPTSQTPSAPSRASPGPRSSLIGGIIGGAVGGIILLSGGIWFIRRRSRVQRTSQPPVTSPAMYDIEPFIDVSRPVSDTLLAEPEQSEKLGRPRKNHPSSGRLVGGAPITGSAASTSSPGVQAPTVERRNETPARAASPAALPTAELVRLLNERLQNQNWDDEEVPPDYPVANVQ